MVYIHMTSKQNGEGGVKAEGDGGGRHFSVMEADTGNLRQVRHDNDGVLPSAACDEYPWEDFGSEPVGGHRVGERPT